MSDQHATSNMHSKLQIYAIRNDSRRIRYLLSKGYCLNTRTGEDGQHMTALHLAAQLGDMCAVKALVDQGADIHSKTRAGLTPLYMAMNRKQSEVCKYLIAQGASIDVCDSDGFTAMHMACIGGVPLDLLDLMIDKCPKAVNMVTKDDMFSCLHLAARYDKWAICETLIKHNALINAIDSKGRSALYHAIDNGCFKAAEVLIKSKADLQLQVGLECSRPLRVAITKNNIDMINLLLNSGVDTGLKDGRCRLPIHIAARCNSWQSCELLIKRTDSLNAEGDWHGITALHLAASENNFEAARVLIQNGANLEANGKLGATPLHVAANHGSYETVELLANAGADINATDYYGRTPLYLAAEEGNTNIVRLLLDRYKADPILRDLDKLSPLEVATARGRAATVSAILSLRPELIESSSDLITLAIESNADHKVMVELFRFGAYLPPAITDQLIMKKNKGLRELMMRTLWTVVRASRDNTQLLKISVTDDSILNAREYATGYSALHYAVEYGNTDLVKHYLELGASLNIPARNGLTTLHTSILHDNLEITSKLIDHAMKNLTPTELRDYLDAKTTQQRETALHMASELGLLQVARSLLRAGATYDLHNRSGERPSFMSRGKVRRSFKAAEKFFRGVTSGNIIDVTQALTIEPAIVNARSHACGGRSALAVSIEHGQSDVTRTLLNYGANVWNVDADASTILKAASSKGDAEIVKLIIDKCPENETSKFVNFRTTKEGETALHVAKNVEVARLLLQSGAYYNAKNRTGKRPVDVCQDEGARRLLELVDRRSPFEPSNNSKQLGKLDIAAVIGAAEDPTSVSSTARMKAQDAARESARATAPAENGPVNKQNDGC